MQVNVFDRYIVIKDRDGHPYMDESLVERLDEMFNTYGVAHSFSLPREKTIEECPEAALELAYNSCDEMAFSLVYMLFNKTYRAASDEGIAKSMVAVSAKFMDDKEV